MPRSPVEEFLTTTGSLVVINLPFRTDRRRDFAEGLRRVGLSPDDPRVRIYAAQRPEDPAGFPSVGARGCFLSHLSVLREALEAGQSSVLVCEDDMDFTADMIPRLPGLTAELQRQPWSLFYGGYQGPPPGDPVAAGLVRADPGRGILCSHFYVVRGSAIADLVRYLEAILTREPGDPAGGPMHFDGAINHFRADHPEHITLLATPPIGVQRPSRTDIHPLKWFDRLPAVRELVGGLRRLRARRA